VGFFYGGVILPAKCFIVVMQLLTVVLEATVSHDFSFVIGQDLEQVFCIEDKVYVWHWLARY